MKRVLITGISGMDGSHLAELLLEKEYEVHGFVRRVAAENQEARLSRINHILMRHSFRLHYGDITNMSEVHLAIAEIKPDEIYHLAAQSDVALSFEMPYSTMHTNIGGTLHVLTGIRTHVPECKMYFAGSSEMFGQAEEMPQNEQTPFYPRSPYGISKVAGFHLARNYRESYGIFVCGGICFNHESPRRGEEFVTRKIAKAAARISMGKQKTLILGNLDAKRDWGAAQDYVEAMYLMLQQSKPDDYVIATGETHSVRDFCREAFGCVALDYKDYVETDDSFKRPADVQTLCGDAAKAKEVLGWEPKTKFKDLVKLMVEAEM